MGVGSFKPLTNIANKSNGLVNKVIGNKVTNGVAGVASQVLKRFPTPQDVANLPDPLKTNQWEAIFPSFNINMGIGTSVPYQPIPEDISFTLPEIEIQNLQAGKNKFNIATNYSTSTNFSATFYCDMNATIINYYDTWRALAVHDDHLVGFPEEYKKRVYIYLLGFRSVVPVCLIKFLGVFPIKITQTSLKSTCERVTYTITFSVDRIETEMLGGGQAVTTYTNNIVGNALTQFGSVSSLSGLFQI